MRAKKLKVGIIFGGRSGEHEVSFCSASSIIKAINRDKYIVIPIGITKEGRWISPYESALALESGKIEGKSTVILVNNPSGKSLISIDNHQEFKKETWEGKLDVIFPVLHGPYGEDGTIQGLLELADIPYVGAGVASSAVSMDKELMKTIFRQKSLPVLKWLTIKRKDWQKDKEEILSLIQNTFEFPLFVKPTNLGSSVGITKVHRKEELEKALDLASSYDRKILIEEGLEGAREIECSVLGNDEPQTSVVGEVKPAGEFYDYDSKYIDQATQLIIPADLPEEVSEKVRKIALCAFQAIDAAGMARVDFFVTKKENKIYLNEINTIPGFTSVSMYPRLWEASGVSYSKLIDRLIQLALERYQDKKQNKTSYESKLLDK
ncbi:MAG: D-alanine--D-alanine ligase [Candidatus Infernicultor aquiphilus]|uniref:D-alanine--D-alanine ligase n=2 Tax=Candidatus Infernicultor aquiphilus TaxID=1805029 RepID=A0A1J5H480_9BACT|nr:MAG: D-alanine--D-alanine ligase A [Candidatus Atribacteria bacterium CG2_30_33_13]PIX34434.1 MAG: D-alanine--D-alanine ligase [Candidatus Atribacteria bacterium CG_4_8_14_3_um_filter_34_18]PIY32446.1 MAG: D-alanine--D-alanine ligase [Candidatus Atribacteria bacterium CG_4_10_14_3_um_filter_34_13]